MKIIRGHILSFFCLFTLLSSSAYSAFLIQHSIFYHSSTDNADKLEYNRMNNYLFLGASLDSGKRVYFGQSTHILTKSHKSQSDSQSSTLNITELGPRLIWFLDEARNWPFSIAYHPYAKGKRSMAGVSEKVSGSAFIAAFGYQLKITKNFYMGASVNYHSLSLASSTVNNVEAQISHSYTTIMPMLDLSIRF